MLSCVYIAGSLFLFIGDDTAINLNQARVLELSRRGTNITVDAMGRYGSLPRQFDSIEELFQECDDVALLERMD